ncbi:STAGA complex 65 subunit gamma-like [Amphiura filiformis]|uniref:STAGA complex 65 subunit gamma-like n=1 Tax=Amphiura filiformis TaxID=82378 RepID=UPI003B21F4F6
MASGNTKNNSTKEVQQQEVVHSHWGEFITPKSPTSSKAISVLDIESPGLKPKSIVIEPPRPHQPIAQQKNKNPQPLPAELCRPDQLSLNTIQLLKQNTRIRCAMMQFPNDPSKYDDKSNVPLLASPPPPTSEMKYSADMDSPERKKGKKYDDKSNVPLLASPPPPTSEMKYSADMDSPESMDKIPLTDGTVEIDNSVARQLGRRAVGTICAHSGFELIQESSLETLTDILHEYETKVCKLLRTAVDKEAITGYTGFQDVLAQVFQEIGVGSTEKLYNFWKTRVKDYNTVIQHRNAQLKERMQLKRSLSTSSMGEDSKSPRMKEEPFSDIHFPETDQEHEPPVEGASESQSQPLAFSNLDLDEASRAASNIPVEGEGQWPAYIKTEAPEGAGQNDDSRNVADSAASEHNEDESAGSFVSESPSIVDIDVTSPPKNMPSSSQELASPPPPKKKRKKSGGTPS